jgi:acyl dehydratase
MMAEITLKRDELRNYVGKRLGASSWHEITQEQVGLFADATGDHQWIHVDPERAKAGPFGRTIAHGFLTLSLAPLLVFAVLDVPDASFVVNYGLNKVRFPAPVPVGGRVRLGATVASADQRPDGSVEAIFALSFELEGGAKPVCVAEGVFRYLPAGDD